MKEFKTPTMAYTYIAPIMAGIPKSSYHRLEGHRNIRPYEAEAVLASINRLHCIFPRQVYF